MLTQQPAFGVQVAATARQGFGHVDDDLSLGALRGQHLHQLVAGIRHHDIPEVVTQIEHVTGSPVSGHLAVNARMVSYPHIINTLWLYMVGMSRYRVMGMTKPYAQHVPPFCDTFCHHANFAYSDQAIVSDKQHSFNYLCNTLYRYALIAPQVVRGQWDCCGAETNETAQIHAWHNP